MLFSFLLLANVIVAVFCEFTFSPTSYNWLLHENIVIISIRQHIKGNGTVLIVNILSTICDLVASMLPIHVLIKGSMLRLTSASLTIACEVKEGTNKFFFVF